MIDISTFLNTDESLDFDAFGKKILIKREKNHFKDHCVWQEKLGSANVKIAYNDVQDSFFSVISFDDLGFGTNICGIAVNCTNPAEAYIQACEDLKKHRDKLDKITQDIDTYFS